MLSIPLITCSMVFLFWIIIKRPTFNNCDFNSNGSAFIMFALGMVSLSGWCFLLEKHSIKPRSWTIAVITLAIILGIESYQLHARGSLLGVLGFLFVYFVLPKNPGLYTWFLHVLFFSSALYSFMEKRLDTYNTRFRQTYFQWTGNLLERILYCFFSASNYRHWFQFRIYGS